MNIHKERFLSQIADAYIIAGFAFILLAIVLIATPIAPYIVYRLHPSETTNDVEKLSQTVVDKTNIQDPTVDPTLPPIDESLPKDPYISIPKIGVYSPISTISDYTEALKHGAWMVPDYGTPTNKRIPIIIAAHRFGYIYWDAQTRTKVSFYNLPKTKVGDTIEIIWEQRKFTYEIYAGSEGSAIKDYSADLILYTCKYFNTPTRIFRYARLVTP